MKEAQFYDTLDNQAVICRLCPHSCHIAHNKTGICGVRKNSGGTLYSLAYGKVIAEHVDPIEKKPLFHFYPGSKAFSIAAVGCNFRCLHCQNSDISQMPRDRGIIMGDDRTPEDIVAMAQKAGCASISYTYTEPTVNFELACATAKLAHEKGIKNNFVTNGYISQAPLKMIQPWLNAANIDLKAFSEDFYKDVCGARLQPVLDAIRAYKTLGIWIEITTLLIPDLNDSAEELEKIARFIAETGREIPWHVTAFYPTYRLVDRPPTSIKTLVLAREIGLKAGLRYVYTGNVPGDEGENTYCWQCGMLLIERYGFSILKNNLLQAACPGCKATLDGLIY